MNDNLNIFNPFGASGINKFDMSYYKFALQDHCRNQDIKKLNYQIVILGAGKGSRMSINYPKVLYELDYPGRSTSIIDNTLSNIRSLKKSVNISDVYIAVDEKASHYFNCPYIKNEAHIIELGDKDIRGTAVSINAIKKSLNPDYFTIFLWGDLAIWRVSDLNLVLSLQSLTDSSLAFPTRIKQDPYVAFVRSGDGNISSIIHSNEGKGYTGLAEQDCLSFSCAPGTLDYLDDFLLQNITKKEVDFVHFIKFLVNKELSVLPVPISEQGSVFGLNTPKRAKEINIMLRNLSTKDYSNFFRSTKW